MIDLAAGDPAMVGPARPVDVNDLPPARSVGAQSRASPFAVSLAAAVGGARPAPAVLPPSRPAAGAPHSASAAQRAALAYRAGGCLRMKSRASAQAIARRHRFQVAQRALLPGGVVAEFLGQDTGDFRRCQHGGLAVQEQGAVATRQHVSAVRASS